MSRSRRGVAILGVTGSIGRQTLEVLARSPEEYSLEVVTCGHQGAVLEEIRQRLGVRDSYCPGQPRYSTLRDQGELCDLLRSPRVDVVVCAIQGSAALPYVMAALEAGKRVCLATKEVMVAAGEWVNSTARAHSGSLMPVDSEHCAIFQCLQGQNHGEVRNLWLTCSGGPFHGHPEIPLHQVTPQQALCHPTWNMGRKITLDCATLMNKALEMIEARWLFHLPGSRIQVVIHPQSLVHSMVEFVDGAVLAQMGTADMRLPIQYCLTYPERRSSPCAPLDFLRPGGCRMDFLPPDETRFPALALARRVMETGGGAGAVFQAANEAALQRFLQGTLAFDAIPWAVEHALDTVPSSPSPDSLEAVQSLELAAARAVQRYSSPSALP
ncbi:MAG: 1-deoxy-D-xylulose-5-phosphate reductoisomerase [Oligosphaeraceae bacterium]